MRLSSETKLKFRDSMHLININFDIKEPYLPEDEVKALIKAWLDKVSQETSMPAPTLNSEPNSAFVWEEHFLPEGWLANKE